MTQAKRWEIGAAIALGCAVAAATWPAYTRCRQEERLRAAAINANEYRVKRILADGVNVNASDRDGWTALMSASGNRNGAIVRALLDFRAAVDRRNGAGQTALDVAKANRSRLCAIIRGQRAGGIITVRQYEEELRDVRTRYSDVIQQLNRCGAR